MCLNLVDEWEMLPKGGNTGASGMVALPKPSVLPGKGPLFTSNEAGLYAAKLRLGLISLDSKPCVLHRTWSQSLQLQWQSKVEHAWNRKRFGNKIPVWELWILEGLVLEDHGTPRNSLLWPYTVCGEENGWDPRGRFVLQLPLRWDALSHGSRNLSWGFFKDSRYPEEEGENIYGVLTCAGHGARWVHTCSQVLVEFLRLGSSGFFICRAVGERPEQYSLAHPDASEG